MKREVLSQTKALVCNKSPLFFFCTRLRWESLDLCSNDEQTVPWRIQALSEKPAGFLPCCPSRRGSVPFSCGLVAGPTVLYRSQALCHHSCRRCGLHCIVTAHQYVAVSLQPLGLRYSLSTRMRFDPDQSIANCTAYKPQLMFT